MKNGWNRRATASSPRASASLASTRTTQLPAAGAPSAADASSAVLAYLPALCSRFASTRSDVYKRQLLGVPVVPISASKNEGIGELVDHALHVARYQEPPVCQDFCAADAHGGAVHRCLHGIMALVGDHAERAGIPVRFAASKLAEGDALVLEKLALDDNERQMLGHIGRQLEEERGLDLSLIHS